METVALCREQVPRPGETPAAAIERIESASRRLTTPCGGGKMVWRCWGEGPVVVLLHGGYGSWRHWIRTIPALAGYRTVLVPDLPGLGDSDDFPGEVPLGVADVVAAGLEQVVPDGQPFDLVGFSFGALVGGHVAASLGAALRSLTLVAPGALGLARRTVTLLRWKPDMPQEQSRDIHRTNLLRLMNAHPHSVDELALLIHAHNMERARVSSRAAGKTDSLAQALRRNSPKRLNAVWGALDAVAGPYLAEREAFVRALRPDAGFHVIPDAGHWVAYEAPEQFNLLLGRLLADALNAD